MRKKELTKKFIKAEKTSIDPELTTKIDRLLIKTAPSV